MRIVIVGGARCGKSWLARSYRHDGVPTYCGDPADKVKDLEADVTYLPNGLAMEDESTRYIAENWFTLPSPWVCEGWLMARALRKWMRIVDEETLVSPYPCDRVIVFRNQRPEIDLKRGQVAMHKAVMTVWNKIAEYFEPITEER